MRTITFGQIASADQNTVFLLPEARPERVSEQYFYGQSHNGMPRGPKYATPPEIMLEAESQGRILWGYSPWRAGKFVFSWEDWDQFALQWFGKLPPTVAKRPKRLTILGLGVLVAEVAALVTELKTTCLNYPLGLEPVSILADEE